MKDDFNERHLDLKMQWIESVFAPWMQVDCLSSISCSNEIRIILSDLYGIVVWRKGDECFIPKRKKVFGFN